MLKKKHALFASIHEHWNYKVLLCKFLYNEIVLDDVWERIHDHVIVMLMKRLCLELLPFFFFFFIMRMFDLLAHCSLVWLALNQLEDLLAFLKYKNYILLLELELELKVYIAQSHTVLKVYRLRFTWVMGSVVRLVK